MKKLLLLTLALILSLSLCACDTDPAEDTDDKTAGSSADSTGDTDSTDTTDDADKDDDSANDDSSDETGYVGTWKVIPPDENPFPPLTLVINADGTATMGGEEYFWYESLDPKEPEGSIELAREDNMGYGDDAHITEDGRLYLEKNMTVNGNSYDHIYFERQ